MHALLISLAVLTSPAQDFTVPTAMLLQKGGETRLELFQGQTQMTIAKSRWHPIGWNQRGQLLLALEPKSGSLYVWDKTQPDTPAVEVAKNVDSATWNPRGDQFAIAVRGKGIAVMQRGEGGAWNLTNVVPIGRLPNWSPEGERLIFAGLGKTGGLWISNADGTMPRRVVRNVEVRALSMSPDGRTIGYVGVTPAAKGVENLFVVRSDGRGNRKAGVASGLSGWDPTSSRIFTPKGSYSLSGRTWNELPARLVPLQWVGVRRYLAIQDGRLLEVDTSSNQVRPVSPTGATVEAVAQVPPVLASGGPTLPLQLISRLPRPALNETKLQGWVEDVDPIEGTLRIQVRTVIDGRGREINLSKPEIQELRIESRTELLTPTGPRRLRTIDARQDTEICVVATRVFNAPLPVKSAALADFEDPVSLETPPINRPRRYTEYDGVTMEREIVPMIFPVAGAGRWSDTFLAERGGGTRRHHGQDIMAPKMSPLVATFDGTVYFQRSRGGNAGNSITLEGDNGYTSLYLHVNNDTPGTDDGRGTDLYAFAPGLRSGDRVTAGQFLGWVGDSGNAENTGPHLHYELHDNVGGGILNAAHSLRVARKMVEALASAEADELKPATGEHRWDGIVKSIDPAKRAVQVQLTAQMVGGPKTKRKAVTKPTLVWARLGSTCEVYYRSNENLKFTLGDLKPGFQVVMLGRREASRFTARQLAFEL